LPKPTPRFPQRPAKPHPTKPRPAKAVQNSASTQSPSHSPITPARAAAFAILSRVATTTSHSDDLLHGPGMSALSQADRNLATTLVLGVLRWQIALDARIQPLLQRPDQALPTPVATALRMGAFQLQHLDRIPAHAALSESVELVRAANHPHTAGMVNAILRNLTRQPPTKPKLYETTAAFAERLAHPLWLVNRWVQNYGHTAALAICAHDQNEPQQGTLFHQPTQTTPEVQASEAPTTEATTQESAALEPRPATLSYPEEPPATIRYPEALASGLISQQKEEGVLTPALPHLDDGSRLVAELAAALHPSPTRIWDTCAAPGGKTLILTHRHPTAQLLATDANPRRLQSLTTRLQTAAPTARTLLADATALPAAEGPFDLILCDVPCTGTGTLSRNPEIRHRLQPSDLARQATRQREILTSALTHLAPGGHLLYSTCSLEPEENEQVLAAVLAKTPGITNPSLEPTLNHLAATNILTTAAPATLLRNGHLRTLPGANFQGDGFFAALLHRP
jgi:16S rRNA (cytosine967-C5)-methyltransferase